jgi:hypothetical protein
MRVVSLRSAISLWGKLLSRSQRAVVSLGARLRSLMPSKKLMHALAEQGLHRARREAVQLKDLELMRGFEAREGAGGWWDCCQRCLRT